MPNLRALRLLGLTSLAVTSTLLAGGTAGAAPQKLFYSGFESGYPGEFLDYDNGTLTDKDVPNPGKNEAWSIVGADKFDEVFVGDKVYKGWITAKASDSHRAYPVIHVDFPTPLANTFWVYLDVDYDKLDPGTDWVHFGTWGNNPDWVVHTMSVLDGKLHMAHLDNYKYTGPMPQPDFPLRKWVRITVYLHYPETGDGTVCAWQDGEPVMTGKWTQVDGPHLRRAHWGMYAAKSVSSGVQYNDEIQLWTLDEKLANCDGPEPASPYPQPGDSGGESTGSESTGDPDTTSESTGAADTGNTGDTGDTGDASTGAADSGPESTGPVTTSSATGGDLTTGAEGDADGAGSTGGDAPTTDGTGETTAPGTTTGASTGDGGSSSSDGADATESSGCGCTTGPGDGLGWLGLGLLAALRRRRVRA